MSETVTVSQLNNRVKTLLNHASVRDIWVSGEISGLKKYASGHYYFTLKDEKSSVAAVLFSSYRANMSFEPREGDKVEAFGRVDLYTQSGKYQFVVNAMRHSGIGELYIRFEELKNKLKDEGLFDESRKRKLPRYPRRIGVVTSQSGAVIHDIITTSASRFPADIFLAPSQVQGEGAAKTIVAGIELLDRFGVDIIIVARGGGSLEDLWPFNEEIVARAIAASKTPVVSAVGHETDFTIADFVSDMRAPTPTGAAALILRDRLETVSEVESLMQRASRSLEQRSVSMEERLDNINKRISLQAAIDGLYDKLIHLEEIFDRADRAMDVTFERAHNRVDMAANKMSAGRTEDWIGNKAKSLDDLSARAIRALRNRSESALARYSLASARIMPSSIKADMDAKGMKVDSLLDKVSATVSDRMNGCRTRMIAIGSRPDKAIGSITERSAAHLETASRNLEGLNPLNILSRGYGFITSAEGDVLTSAGSMSKGDRVTIHMRDGSATAEIKDKEMKK